MSTTRDLPQASVLPKVRRLVAELTADGSLSLKEAGARVGLSPRHAQYYGAAATATLGLLQLEEGRLRVTAIGRELLATAEGSLAERDILCRAILDSPSVTSIAHDLVADPGPTREALTHRMVAAGLSPKTARRRASTLLSWRRYVLDRQATWSDLPAGASEDER